MFIAIRTDQKWVATGKWKGLSGPSVSVWDASKGDKVADVPHTFTANVAFTPDGKWLTTSTSQEYRFVRVGTWKTEFSRAVNLDFVSNICFTAGSRIQAISPGTWGLQLTEAATGNPIVTLDDVGEEQPIKFSPDDGELATWCVDGTLRLWDLRLIRRELSEVGLDWPGPPLPPRAAQPLMRLSLAKPAAGPVEQRDR
jgi:WD40 repeat protein